MTGLWAWRQTAVNSWFFTCLSSLRGTEMNVDVCTHALVCAFSSSVPGGLVTVSTPSTRILVAKHQLRKRSWGIGKPGASPGTRKSGSALKRTWHVTRAQEGPSKLPTAKAKTV